MQRQRNVFRQGADAGVVDGCHREAELLGGAVAAAHGDGRHGEGVDHRGHIVARVAVLQGVLHHVVGIGRGVLLVGQAQRVVPVPGEGVGQEAALQAVEHRIDTRGAGGRFQVVVAQHVAGAVAAAAVFQGQRHILHLVAEGGAAEEVGVLVVDLGAVEDIVVVVGGKDAVAHGTAQHREVRAVGGGDGDGVARRRSREPLAHADARVGTLAAVDDDNVALHVVEVLVALDGIRAADALRHRCHLLAGEEDIGLLPEGYLALVDEPAGLVGERVDRPPGLGAVHGGVEEVVLRDVDGRQRAGLGQHHAAAVDIDGAIVGPQVIARAVVVVGAAEVVLHGDVVEECEGAVAGNVDGAHEGSVGRQAVGVELCRHAAVVVPVVLHRGAVLEGHRAAVHHLDDGAIDAVGVGRLGRRGSLLDDGAGTAVEGDVLGREGST